MKSERVHKIVEYIKRQAEFPFDVDEVMEDLDNVLRFFGTYEGVTEAEKKLLKKDLSKLAIEEEFREMEHVAKGEPYME